MKIRKDDEVIIITGKDRGKTGKVEAVFPETNRIIVAGLNRYKKHLKPSTKHPAGGITEFSRPLHFSNVMLLDPESKKPTRIGFRGNKGEKHRVARLTNRKI